MDKNRERLSKYKMLLFVNKCLYSENIIENDVYEKVESNLLNIINNISNRLENV